MNIRLTPKQQGELERLVGKGKTEVRHYRRAQMVLWSGQGLAVSAIARRLGSNRSVVRKWLRRYLSRGVRG